MYFSKGNAVLVEPKLKELSLEHLEAFKKFIGSFQRSTKQSTIEYSIEHPSGAISGFNAEGIEVCHLGPRAAEGFRKSYGC